LYLVEYIHDLIDLVAAQCMAPFVLSNHTPVQIRCLIQLANAQVHTSGSWLHCSVTFYSVQVEFCEEAGGER